MSTNTKLPVLEAQVDAIAQFRDDLYGGVKVVYDDKAKAIEMLKYGLFMKPRKGLLIGLGYNRSGDKSLLESTMIHEVNKNTKVGNTVTYDLDYKRIST